MTKNCPACGQDVPDYAKLCKHCFHDFSNQSQRRFPLGLSVSLFVLSLIAMFGIEHLASSQMVKRYNLFPEAQALLIASSSRAGITADRIPFSDITHLEHITGGDTHQYEIVAVIKNGDRIMLQGSDDKLINQAEDMAKKTDLILKKVQNGQAAQ